MRICAAASRLSQITTPARVAEYAIEVSQPRASTSPAFVALAAICSSGSSREGGRDFVSISPSAAASVLTSIGLDFPLLWGLVAFLFNYVPNIGGFVAAVPTLLVALVQPGLGTGAMFIIGLGHAVIHTVIGNIVEPAWMGRKLGLSPLVVLLCLVFWGWVWGPVGMLLSVPLTMAVKIALESDEQLRWIAVLLGPTPAEPKRDARTRA